MENAQSKAFFDLRPIRTAIACLLLVLAFSTGAWPASAGDTPAEFYRTGAYDRAIQTGVAEDTATGLTIAARAMMAQEMMRETPCLDCLRKTEKLLRQAIRKNPNLANPHIFLAAAIGYQTRIIGIVAARLRGYADAAKDEIDTALRLEPNNSWALAAIGGWNIEIARVAGDALANMLYGATLDAGVAAFQKAFQAAPGNIVLRYQYALALSGYDRKKYLKEVESALNFAATGVPQTAYETYVQRQARTMLAALQHGDIPAYEKLRKRAQGYPAD
jgi:hypothetical protein